MQIIFFKKHSNKFSIYFYFLQMNANLQIAKQYEDRIKEHLAKISSKIKKQEEKIQEIQNRIDKDIESTTIQSVKYLIVEIAEQKKSSLNNSAGGDEGGVLE